MNVRYDHTGNIRRLNFSLTYHLGDQVSTDKNRRVEESGRIR